MPNIKNEELKDGENDPTDVPATDPVTTSVDRKNRAISHYVQVKDGFLISHVLYYTVL